MLARGRQKDRKSHPRHGGHLRQISIALAALLLTISLGTAGYVLVERWSFLDALYMVVVTITTVGYKEVHPLSRAGQVLTMGVVIFGVATAGYTIGTLGRMLMEGELRRLFGRTRLDEKIRNMKNHFIICGCGRMGRLLCEELAQARTPFVVVEKDPAREVALADRGWLHIIGDAADEEVLREAGIEHAKGLATMLPTDANNVFVTLTARQLRQDLVIIARAEDPGAEPKLRSAGANRVVSPHAIGARRAAQLIMHPEVVDFIEVVTRRGTVDFEMGEMLVTPQSPFVGRSLRESHIRQAAGATVVAIKRADGHTIFNPAPDEKILAGDTLITIGPYGATKDFPAKTQSE